MKKRKFKDTVHNFTAITISKNSAWMLIRNKCHELKLQVPTIEQIIEIK